MHTGMTSSYGRCQASKDGKAKWSNSPTAQADCTPLPFRIGGIESIFIDITKCPLAKPIYSVSNMCSVSSDCRAYIVDLFADMTNFKKSYSYTYYNKGGSKSTPITTEELTKFKGQVTAISQTCEKHSVCASKYGSYDSTKRYFTSLKARTWGKGSRTRPRYNGKDLVRRICRNVQAMGCCFREFLKTDVENADVVGIQLEETLETNGKYCRNLPTKTCSETCVWDKKKRDSVQCTIQHDSRTVHRTFVNREHAKCQFIDKYNMAKDTAATQSTDNCHASKCSGLSDVDCDAHPLCNKKTKASLKTCTLVRKKICIAQHRRRLSIPNHPHGRRLSLKAGSVDTTSGRAMLASGVIGMTKTYSAAA
jgi:hypothetical protein